MPGWRVHISPKYNRTGRTLHVETGHKYSNRLLSLPMFETRLVASLSQLGISILARANSLYNMSLLLFSLSSNQPPAKKATWRKKGKRIRHMKKRKETENGNTPGSDEVKNCISNHCTLLGAQPSSWRELRTMKDPLCMNTAKRLQ